MLADMPLRRSCLRGTTGSWVAGWSAVAGLVGLVEERVTHHRRGRDSCCVRGAAWRTRLSSPATLARRGGRRWRLPGAVVVRKFQRLHLDLFLDELLDVGHQARIAAGHHKRDEAGRRRRRGRCGRCGA